jgi:hypothetical protein
MYGNRDTCKAVKVPLADSAQDLAIGIGLTLAGAPMPPCLRVVFTRSILQEDSASISKSFNNQQRR